MLPNGLGQLAEGAEATAGCPATPPLKFSFGNLALRAGVNSLERLTQTHCAAEFGVLATEIFTLLLTLLRFQALPRKLQSAPLRSEPPSRPSSRRTSSSAWPANTMRWNLSKTILA